MENIDRAAYLKRMQEAVADFDYERGHIRADELLVELLQELGYSDIADVYEDGVGFWWYA